MEPIGWLIALFLSLLHTLGLASAFHAILNARTSSGAIAWSISLVTFPYLTVPVYWVLSRQKFYGYVKLLRTHTLAHHRYQDVEACLENLESFRAAADTTEGELDQTDRAVLENLTHLPFTARNKVKLLVDGENTFKAMFEAIDQAKDYILVLFYIIGDDEIGQEFKRHLLARADAGVRIHVLYDELGCLTFLSQSYIDELRERGIEVHPFYTTRGGFNKLQYNFRNHRKIVVVDGKTALVGGINVHDDSCGRSNFYGNWRDTHSICWGPVVQNIQLIWAQDYYWATASLPELNWKPTEAADGDQNALYVATGPASNLASGVLFFLHCIHQAKDRLWLASPYFIPDPSVIDALILASLRGVDVRIIIPERYDMLMMYLANFSTFPEIEHSGIRVFRYHTGYPHQKCMLVDDRLAWVGSANVDNRSMRLNFEGNLVVQDRLFCKEMEDMLSRDLDRSVEVGPEDYNGRGYIFKLGVKIARLFSPIL
jgi:cardiolipin synthase A/B